MTVSWNIIGHSQAVTRLAEAVREQQPPHAYLFTGPPNLGKATVARLFAQALLCEKDTAPCSSAPARAGGHCAQCTLLSAGHHPDYVEFPEDGVLTIAQVRHLRETFRLKPHSAHFRVALIPDSERLGVPAQNALLKLLEEPPPHTVIILTARSPEALLATTVSRCQHLVFTVPSTDELRSALGQQKRGVDEAIRASHRRPGLALRLLDDEATLSHYRDWEDELMTLVEAGVVERLSRAKELAADEHLPEMFDVWLALHREALHGELGLAEDSLSKAATHLARHYTMAQLERNLASLVAARKRLRYNPNVLLLVENLLLGLGE